MASTTRTIEGVELDTRVGLYCDICASFSVTSIGVALTDSDSLEVLGRFYGTVCGSCGAESVHR